MGQPEAGSPNWQVNPAAVGQPENRFNYISAQGVATNYPNSLGSESAHANQVGSLFYGLDSGVAPAIQQVDNYEAGYFLGVLVRSQMAIAARIVNQSFVDSGQIDQEDSYYDNYVARFSTVFASGVGNGGPPNSPSTAYNCIGVGCLDGPSSVGPTSDGRCKPDLAAPGVMTSFSTPLVAGCAALLYQAGARQDGGAGTASAVTNAITLKALLLNGAEKSPGWTNSASQPLDFRHGAGVVNALNSYRQLRGGRQLWIMATTHPVGGAHLPPATSSNAPARRGWDFNTISSTTPRDGVNHYLFDLRNSTNRLFHLAATLVWNRQLNKTGIKQPRSVSVRRGERHPRDQQSELRGQRRTHLGDRLAARTL